jgi:PAS domain S-box-containing protein
MKPTILLVEDNEQNLYLATFLLTKYGFEVVQARTGPEGIDLARRVRPAIVLLDIELPLANGYAVARELRKDPALAAAAIIAVTSHAMAGDRAKSIEAGCTDYIEKPINPDTFVAQVVRHLPCKAKAEAKRVLVVDDNAQNRHFLDALLTAYGYGVVQATDGAEALEEARRQPPDLIITDLLMPTMDGYALCRRCKEDDDLKHIPLIVYTSTYTSQADAKLALSLGADRFLIKPLEPDDLVRVIREVLATPRKGRRAPAPKLAKETEYLRQYNEVLVHRLEHKLEELQSANLALTAEVAERIKAEDNADHISHLYAVLSEAGEAVARVRDRRHLFEDACRIAVTTGEFTMAWVALVNRQTGQIENAANHGTPPGPVSQACPCTSFPQQAPCPIGVALRENRVVLAYDIQSDPTMECWRAWAAQCGYRSMAALPLCQEGETLGVLALYAEQTGFFDEPRARLLRKLADSLSFALDFLKRQEDRTAANEALVRSQERYKALVESVTDYIYTMRIEDGRAAETTHSAGSIAVTGYTPEEYLADLNLWLRMVPPEDRDAVAAQAERLLTGQPVGPLEHRILHKNGEIRWIRNTPVLCYDVHGRTVGYDGLVQDITEQRKLQEQLIQAQKMEAVGLLAGGIAHDFRNQLTVIMGYGEMLVRRGLVRGKAMENVQQILKAAARSAELSSQLLAFSRQQELHPEVANVNEMIAGLPRLLGPLVGEDVHLSVTTSEALGNVRIDRGQFQQTLMNLVVNARDAMPRGGRITVETSNVMLDEDFVRHHMGAAPGPHIAVSVTDTGLGMDEGTLKKCFDPFFTTKPVGQGTGLGLSMVYGFVKQSSGYISVESQPERGSTFRLYLPQVTDEARRPAAPGDVADRLPRGKETILLVEDEADVRHLVSSTLRECGYTVLEAAGAEAALPLSDAYEGTIDLLVSDVVMPGINGPELAAQFLARRPRTPVLYLSGYARKALANRGVIHTEVNLLRKPVRASDLARTVQELLRNKP